MCNASPWTVTASVFVGGIVIHQVVHTPSMVHGYDVVIPGHPTVRVLCRADDHEDGATLAVVIRDGLAAYDRDYDCLWRHLHNELVGAGLVWRYTEEAAHA